MVTDIAQKSYKTLFPLRYFKKKRRRGKVDSIGKNLDIETKKKVKLYLSNFA